MQLSNELRGVIEKRLRSATPHQVLAIASALCATEVELAPPSVLGSAGKSRFETRDDIVLDRLTGLMWSRTTLPGGRKSWSDAKAAASSMTLGSHTDWRLPTVRELLSLVDYERHDPAIDTTMFQCESAWYWSSTPYAPSPGDYAWNVNFDNGYASWGLQSGSGFVRAVRVGQSVEHWF